MNYDAYEANAVLGLDANNEPVATLSKAVNLERCDWNDPHTLMWSIYGHLPTGGVECIADCYTSEDAETIIEALGGRIM